MQQLEAEVTDKEKKKGQLHKVFEESFDAKSIDNKKLFTKSQLHSTKSCSRKL